MKTIFFAFLINFSVAFETTEYPQFKNKSKDELQRYMGLHPDYMQDTMLSMFLRPEAENIALPEHFDWREQKAECIH